MEIAEVRDEKSLERYLTALPEDVQLLTARRVAFRAAARVLPKAVRYLVENPKADRVDLTVAPVFGAVSIGGVASTWPTPPIDFAASDAAASDASASAASAAAFAASAAARASASAASAAARASAVSAAAYASDAAIWEIVRADLRQALSDPTAKMGPLWADVPQPEALRVDWSAARNLLEKDALADWSFWIAWYERVLAGQDFLAAEMAEVLNTLREGDREKGPAHINPKFDGVLGLYRAEEFLKATPYGFKAGLNDRHDRLELLAVEVVDLDDVVRKTRAALADFKRRSLKDSSHNQLSLVCLDALADEIANLRRKISANKENAQGLHYELVRAVKHFERVLRDKDLVHTAATLSLMDDLRAMQDEICVLSDPVRQAEKKRMAIALDRATSAELLLAIRTCLGMAADGQGQMRVFASLAMRALANPEASADEKQMAWMFAFRMGADSARLVKGHEAEVGGKQSPFGKRLKEASDLAVAADKGVDVLQEAISEGGNWADALLQYFGQFNIPGF